MLLSPYAEIFRRHNRPMVPLPTEGEPALLQLPGVRAVFFDIYGTLVISGSGDIGVGLAGDRDEALRGALEEMGLALRGPAANGVTQLHNTIAEYHAALRAKGIDYPEVDIAQIWRATLAGLAEQGLLAGDEEEGDAALDGRELRRLAVEYESRANPTWPMPSMEATLAELRGAGLKLGLISNSQFFTPELFPALVGKTLDELGFDPTWRFYSFEHSVAKPSLHLYRLAAAETARHGIRPEEVLYVGNDMRNDIWPAKEVGFRAALFAGDARSLRTRPGNPELEEVLPDAIVTDLAQLAPLLNS